MLTSASFILGVFFAIIGNIIVRPVAKLLGAEGEMLEYCVIYGRILLAALPAFMLQFTFQSFFTAAEKPKLGLYFIIAAGVTNMVLDALFVAILKWGVKGAAVATVLSQAVGGLLPLIYFISKNGSLLRLGKTKLYGKALLKTCTNGASEFLTNVSMSLVNILFNL